MKRSVQEVNVGCTSQDYTYLWNDVKTVEAKGDCTVLIHFCCCCCWWCYYFVVAVEYFLVKRRERGRGFCSPWNAIPLSVRTLYSVLVSFSTSTLLSFKNMLKWLLADLHVRSISHLRITDCFGKCNLAPEWEDCIQQASWLWHTHALK